MNTRFLQRGGLWVLCQGALLLAVIFFGIFFRAKWDGLLAGFVGAAFLVLAALCGISGAIALGRNLTPFPRPVPSGRIVQHGIYRVIRHPLYTAVFCASLGWAFVWQSVPALVVALALGPFLAAKARREERWLRQHYPEYADYERRVRRFVPWLY